jgi:1-acyl-sn-glycerol-3-phosphate acyltransferase
VLRAGKPLLVFPEGTRSEDGRLKAFKIGGFYAAVRAGRPVVPVAMAGTHRLMSRDAVDTGEVAEPERRYVRVCIGKPLEPSTDGDEATRIEELRDRTRAAIQKLLAQLED